VAQAGRPPGLPVPDPGSGRCRGPVELKGSGDAWYGPGIGKASQGRLRPPVGPVGEALTGPGEWNTAVEGRRSRLLDAPLPWPVLGGRPLPPNGTFGIAVKVQMGRRTQRDHFAGPGTLLVPWFGAYWEVGGISMSCLRFSTGASGP